MNTEKLIFFISSRHSRMASSCTRIMMPFLSEKQFLDAIRTVVRDNIAYVPPYGSNGALYLRPLLFGSGPRIGLQPADEYTFLILVIPVGNISLVLYLLFMEIVSLFNVHLTFVLYSSAVKQMLTTFRRLL
jgi:branched-subunit amino acid aminotransferase/4-amino-4-deoxychorismate lyase